MRRGNQSFPFAASLDFASSFSPEGKRGFWCIAMACCERPSVFMPLLFWCRWCFMFLVLLSGFVIVEAFTGTYGVNYGRLADNIPPPESVVAFLKATKIKNVRIYDADHEVLKAFSGSGLDLLVQIGMEYLKNMSTDEDQAMDWIKENVLPFHPKTHIQGIIVGNEVLGGSDQDLEKALYGAVENVYNALSSLQLSDTIEVLTPHSQAVFANSYPPSSCTFNETVLPYMKPLLDFFSQTGSPFFINVYPFISYKGDSEHIDLNYALFQSSSGVYDEKTEIHYDNMFDAEIDAAYAALKAAGFEEMDIRVSETGWASNGDKDEAGATAQNARIYNYNLRKRLAKKKGTPLRPKRVVKAYIFALFNEDSKTGPASEKHYGLFNADGSIAYDVGFRGLKPSYAPFSLLSIKGMESQGWLVPYSLVLSSCIAVLLLVLVR